MAVFEEEMWEEEVAGQSVDLKYHCTLSKRVEQKVNKILRGNTPNTTDKRFEVFWTRIA